MGYDRSTTAAGYTEFLRRKAIQSDKKFFFKSQPADMRDFIDYSLTAAFYIDGIGVPGSKPGGPSFFDFRYFDAGYSDTIALLFLSEGGSGIQDSTYVILDCGGS